MNQLSQTSSKKTHESASELFCLSVSSRKVLRCSCMGHTLLGGSFTNTQTHTHILWAISKVFFILYLFSLVFLFSCPFLLLFWCHWCFNISLLSFFLLPSLSHCQIPHALSLNAWTQPRIHRRTSQTLISSFPCDPLLNVSFSSFLPSIFCALFSLPLTSFSHSSFFSSCLVTPRLLRPLGPHVGRPCSLLWAYWPGVASRGIPI